MLRTFHEWRTLLTASNNPSLLEPLFSVSPLKAFFQLIGTITVVFMVIRMPYALWQWPSIVETVISVSSQIKDHFPADLSVTWNGTELGWDPTDPVPTYYPEQIPPSERTTQFLAQLQYASESQPLNEELIVITPTTAFIPAEDVSITLSDVLPQTTIELTAQKYSDWHSRLVALAQEYWWWGAVVYLGVLYSSELIVYCLFLLTEGLVLAVLIRLFMYSIPRGKLFVVLTKVFGLSTLLSALVDLAHSSAATGTLSLSFWIFTLLIVSMHHSWLEKS